jgi:hypothetical protein
MNAAVRRAILTVTQIGPHPMRAVEQRRCNFGGGLPGALIAA